MGNGIEKPVYYNGYGVNNIKPVKKEMYKEFLVKPADTEKNVTNVDFPYFPIIIKQS